MWSTPHAALTLYFSGFLAFAIGKLLEAPRDDGHPVTALSRGWARGEIEPGVPVLDAEDAMANAAVLRSALAAVPAPGVGAEDGRTCEAAPRFFEVLLDGRLSRVRFGARAVCQLRTLKRISVAQPGFGRRGLAEVAAFVLGRRVPGEADVDVTRIVVPPFRFTGETVHFVRADLGSLGPGEQFIGTYHTHPEGDLEQGILSDTDLQFAETGHVDFAGKPGWLRSPRGGIDWLFDIVEPRDGDWNVYAHDAARLAELRAACDDRGCPVTELRLAGSRYYLLTRFYEERS